MQAIGPFIRPARNSFCRVGTSAHRIFFKRSPRRKWWACMPTLRELNLNSIEQVRWRDSARGFVHEFGVFFVKVG
jgi:hypothetical protein